MTIENEIDSYRIFTRKSMIRLLFQLWIYIDCQIVTKLYMA